MREREGRERDKGEQGEKGEKVLNEHTTTTTNKTAKGENVVATTCKSILSCDVRFWQWYPQKIGQKETTPIRDSNAWVPDHSTRFRVVEKQRSSFAKHPHKSLALEPLLDFFFSIFSFFFFFFFFFFCFFFVLPLFTYTHEHLVVNNRAFSNPLSLTLTLSYSHSLSLTLTCKQWFEEKNETIQPQRKAP